MSKELMESIEERNRQKAEDAAQKMKEGIAKELKSNEMAKSILDIFKNARTEGAPTSDVKFEPWDNE